MDLLEVDKDHGYVLVLEPNDEGTWNYRYLFVGMRSNAYTQSDPKPKAESVPGMTFSIGSDNLATLTLNNYWNPGTVLVIHDMGNGFVLKVPAGTRNSLWQIQVSNKYNAGSLTIAGSGVLNVNSPSVATRFGIMIFGNEQECRLTINKNANLKVGGGETAVYMEVRPDSYDQIPPIRLLGSVKAYSDNTVQAYTFMEGYFSEIESMYYGFENDYTSVIWQYFLIAPTDAAIIPATDVEFR